MRSLLSLRGRVLAGAVLLVGVLLTSTLLLSRQVVVSNFDEFVQRGESRAAREAVAELQQYVDRTGGLDGILPLLTDIHRRTSSHIILLSGERVLASVPFAASAVALSSVEIGSDGTRLVIDVNDGAVQSQVVFQGGPWQQIFDAAHQPLAAVVFISMPGGGDRGEFGGEVNRGFLLVALAIGAAGVLFSGLAAGQLVRPLERLTGAARKLAAGDLTQRVDVSRRDEVGELADAFNVMAAALERNEQLRRNLLDDVAHELRTPVTHFRAELEALQDGLRLPSREVIDRLHADAAHLERLVDDLRDIAQAEAGQLRLAIGPLDANHEIARALASVGPIATARGVRLTRASGPDSASAFADPARLRQILVNLLDNAVRHAPDGSQVIVSVAEEDRLLRISVDDAGPGVPDEHVPHVFDRFYRVDPSRDRRTGGVGLGLAIVRQLVHLQGGEVSAENLSPRGFRVTFTLPRLARSRS